MRQKCHYSFIQNSVTNISNFFHPIRNSRRQMMIEQKEWQYGWQKTKRQNFEKFHLNLNERANERVSERMNEWRRHIFGGKKEVTQSIYVD